MVYVGTRVYKYGRMLMSHMISEDLNELHEMAKKIGISRRHFQDKKGKPHYDVCKSNKKKAIVLGAKEVNDRVIIEILNKHYE